jgi:hypothetical protein
MHDAGKQVMSGVTLRKSNTNQGREEDIMIFRGLRLKVLNPEIGSMIGLRDIRADSLAPA